MRRNSSLLPTINGVLQGSKLGAILFLIDDLLQATDGNCIMFSVNTTVTSYKWINTSNLVKMLGTMLDSHLTWEAHVDYTVLQMKLIITCSAATSKVIDG